MAGLRRVWWVTVWMCLVLVTSACQRHGVDVSASPAPSSPQDVESAGRVSPTYVRDAVELMEDQYVDTVDQADLLRGAQAGLQDYLKDCSVQDGAVDAYDIHAHDAVQNFISLLSDVLNRHADKLQEDKLVYGALRGLMGAVKDPYSVALDPKEYSELTEQMSGGNIGGIGIYIERDRHNGDVLTVGEGVEGSPAVRQGIVAGDEILRINGVSTRTMDLEVAATKIRGPVGTVIHMDIKHPGGAIRDVRMLRELIHVKSAAYRALGEGIGYVKLRFFGQETDEEFDAALTSAEKNGDHALVIDLRNNGGGYIKAAIDVCSKFIAKGSLVVSVVARKSSPELDRATGSHRVHMPVVVLVNGYSASASEITAGALQDTGVAVLLGTRTFGKGSVQTIHDLPDGGALKFTIAHYLTPKGRNINKKGIEPDIVCKMPADRVGLDAQDTQLKAAVAYLKRKVSLR